MKKFFSVHVARIMLVKKQALSATRTGTLPRVPKRQSRRTEPAIPDERTWMLFGGFVFRLRNIKAVQ
jgi:hypothetical protein